MMVRPTTSQLLRDVRHELVETIAPEVTTATARVALEQIDIILEQCAVRADHEIAWMGEEIAEIDDFAGRVIDRTGDEPTAAALRAARHEASGSLALESMCDDYNRMSAALSCAIEACMGQPDRADLLAEAIGILQTRRSERELVVRANWRLVGRG
ncbi:MAG: hypothetical protein ACE37B_06215 [Ilumatobacter sp.]|jgi:hypothetical protein|uniref:hypothetical protein n=1 Tax=Ilumatobacter sp. TaxID=1967498 RepID=UPI00391D0F9F